MEIDVGFEGDRTTLDFRVSPKVSEILDRMKINSETVLVKINGTIEPQDIHIKESDDIELIRIISGG